MDDFGSGFLTGMVVMGALLLLCSYIYIECCYVDKAIRVGVAYYEKPKSPFLNKGEFTWRTNHEYEYIP